MATAPDDASASDAKKSKQERIRDNQRRSRARRQEHLADLEKRLADCRTLCRDAELQRDTLQRLQVENARLRELLVFAGFNISLIDSYVNHGAEPGETAFRQLRPKLASTSATVMPSSANSLLQPNNCTQSYRTSSSCQSTTLEQSTGSNAGVSTERFGMYSTEDAHHQASLPSESPIHTNSTVQSRTPSEAEFCCDSFYVPANGPLSRTTDETILCSVAKELIEQYYVNSEEMETIKARLATGFSRPSMPNQGCRVNNQLLFEVLNEISSKWS